MQSCACICFGLFQLGGCIACTDTCHLRLDQYQMWIGPQSQCQVRLVFVRSDLFYSAGPVNRGSEDRLTGSVCLKPHPPPAGQTQTEAEFVSVWDGFTGLRENSMHSGAADLLKESRQIERETDSVSETDKTNSLVKPRPWGPLTDMSTNQLQFVSFSVMFSGRGYVDAITLSDVF